MNGSRREKRPDDMAGGSGERPVPSKRIGRPRLWALLAAALLSGACTSETTLLEEPMSVGTSTSAVTLEMESTDYDLGFITPSVTSMYSGFLSVIGDEAEALEATLEQYTLMQAPNRARGAVRVKFVDASGQQRTGAGGLGLGGHCGVTFISPSYAVTAAHCVPDKNPIIDVQMYRPTSALQESYLSATVLDENGTHPDFGITYLDEADGYVTDELSCALVARCGQIAAGTPIACPDPENNQFADTAVIHCDGAPGKTYGYLKIAETDDDFGHVGMPWAHEIYDIPEDLPPSNPLYQHYLAYPGSEDPSPNIHYYEGLNQLFPLVSQRWPDGTPRWRGGGGDWTVETDLFGCHGSSGSSIMQSAGLSWEILGPVAGGGSSSRLCQSSAGSQPGTPSMAFAPREYTAYIASLFDLAADCGGQMNAREAFFSHVSTADTLACAPDVLPFTAVPRFLDGPNASDQEALLVTGGAAARAAIGRFTVSAGRAYRMAAVVRPTQTCGGGSNCSSVALGLDGDNALSVSFSGANAGQTFTYAAFPQATAGGQVNVALEGVNGVEVSDVAVVPEDHVFTFDNVYEQAGGGLFAPLDEEMTIGPLPVRFIGDGADGFAAVLRGGERLVLGQAGVSPSRNWWVRFDATNREGLICGFTDAGSVVTRGFDCAASAAQAFLAGPSDAFFYIEAPATDAIIEIDNVAIASDVAPDGDGDGVPDGPDNCPAIPNAGQGPCDAGELSAALVVTNDWGGGYCVVLHASNSGTVPVTGWSVPIDTNHSTIYTSWNGSFSGNRGLLTIAPGFTWNQTIPAGATDTSIGFCANRDAGTNDLPFVVGGDGDGGGGSMTATASVTSSWDVGYCLQVDVTNQAAASTTGWTVTLDMKGTQINQNLWSATYSGSSGIVTATPLGWNQAIAPNATINFGFCANRNGATTIAAVIGATGAY